MLNKYIGKITAVHKISDANFKPLVVGNNSVECTIVRRLQMLNIAYTGVPNILVEKLMENGNVFIIPAIPYLIILFNSFMALMKSSLNWKIAITGILMCAVLFIMIIPHVESYTNEAIVLVHYYHKLYQSIRVCTNAVSINEALIWLIRAWVWTAPLALYTWAYYRFKERTI